MNSWAILLKNRGQTRRPETAKSSCSRNSRLRLRLLNEEFKIIFYYLKILAYSKEKWKERGSLNVGMEYYDLFCTRVGISIYVDPSISMGRLNFKHGHFIPSPTVVTLTCTSNAQGWYTYKELGVPWLFL